MIAKHRTSLEQLERDGFAMIPALIDRNEVTDLIRAIGPGGGSRRNLLAVVPQVLATARAPAVRSLVEEALGAEAFVARAILFNKGQDANWKVSWHQDVSIAVAERREIDGFGPWSVKEGIIHVQPPATILERMLTVRLHLDPCGTENGPLRVVVGSHRGGKLRDHEIEPARRSGREVTCIAAPGDALVMRPLLLHASSAAERPGHRRVVHLEFAATELPGGLRWAAAAA